MKRFVIFILTLSLISLSCQTIYNLANPNTEPTNPSNPDNNAVPSEPPSNGSPSNKLTDIRGKLQELGGKPCDETPDFTCVTLKVPLNHFDSTNSETVDVVFAIAPATGKRYGMYFQAFPGGPGGEGIPYASTVYFPPSIPQHYDIVFFDQRGVGLSTPLECKKAYAKYFLDYINADDTVGQEGYDTPQEQQAAEQEAKSFDEECFAEIGMDPAKIKFFTTDQVAEDIESFRQAVGDDKFMLYGVSYGTSVAQQYARAHVDHLSGLILDGTQDTTLSGDQIAFSQWEAANMVLTEVFKACDADRSCSRDVGGNSQAAYDQLAQKLANAAIPFEYPVSGGQTVKRLFTTHMLDLAAVYPLYGLNNRRALMQAVAAANQGDLVPLAQLYYSYSNVDPETDQYVGDPNFSDTMYYIVWCSDDAYYNGTPQQRADKLMQEGQKLNGIVPRLDLDVMPLGLACAYMSSAPASEKPLEPLKAPGVPVLVLAATLDPATPFHEGKTVAENLENGYFIYVNGGLHGTYGNGFDCPDQYVNDFLLKGTLPNKREIVCDWPNAVLGQ